MTGTTSTPGTTRSRAANSPSRRSTAAPTSSTPRPARPVRACCKAAADAGKLGIGVDSNQDNLFPGKVLTSMLKRVDVATYKTFMDAKNGTWKAGVQVLGLKEGGVDYADGRHTTRRW